MSGTIIVDNPNTNSEIFRRFLIDEAGGRRALVKELRERGVMGESHPRVIDLGSGEGGVAMALIEAEWKAENITCVDWCKPNEEKVAGVVRKYWDLGTLVERIDDPGLPLEIKNLAQTFDVVISVNVTGENLDLGNLCKLAKFFVKPGGFIWIR